MDSRLLALFRLLADWLGRFASFLLRPPESMDEGRPLTLAIPEARSTHDPGAVGWANRPPARILCPSCNARFVQEYANDVIRCSTCRFERPPDELDETLLIALLCPTCRDELTTGIRHPNVFSLPQWGSCDTCHYHWEFGHDFRRPGRRRN